MRSEKTFTLIELITVVIVVGILVAAGIINYSKTLQNMRQREAVNLIDAIYSAEKSYGVESYNAVEACTGIADCNTKLHIALPLSTSCTYAASDLTGGVFCVQADCGASFKLKKNSSTNTFTQGALCP